MLWQAETFMRYFSTKTGIMAIMPLPLVLYKPRMALVCSRIARALHTSKGFSGPSSLVKIHNEVDTAIHSNKPVVALESTILTHGMPFPDNLEYVQTVTQRMAIAVENEIRLQGAVPATIALIDGKAHVGLSASQLERVSSQTTSAVKISRRDLAYALNKGVVGGTTISATMVLANIAGIQLFVSGGLGGVHRGGEVTMDVSADLTELGRTPVALVTSGVKSILDIGRTLEYLETQGVCVATYGKTNDFPAFFTSKSGFKSSCNVETVDEAAALIDTTFSLGLNNGILIANPIPAQYEMDGQAIEGSIQQAVAEASDNGISGREITPYILQRVNELTSGDSLKANIALVKNNASVGASIAVRLASLKASGSHRLAGKRHYSTQRHHLTPPALSSSSNGPIVIGACNMDTVQHIQTDPIMLDGSTNIAKTSVMCGGVGRNLCDALCRLGTKTKFLTALGNDHAGQTIMSLCSHMDWSKARILDNCRTATYTVVLDRHGDVYMGVGDMSIHDEITPQYILENEEAVMQSSLVVLDGNVSHETIKTVGDLCSKHAIPLFYEPTDTAKATKPFQVNVETSITFTKPNINEMLQMVKFITGRTVAIPNRSSENYLDTLAVHCSVLVQRIPNVILTLGASGLLYCTSESLDTVMNESWRRYTIVKECDSMNAIHIPSRPAHDIKSLSGAGDCLAASYIHGLYCGLNALDSLAMGTKAAAISAEHYEPVPANLKELLDMEDKTNDVNSIFIPTAQLI